jgi:ATP-dependent Clp protease ATP-binding subunit ClpA
MMLERFTDGARHVLVQAQHDARRLGHNYIGCEHLLLAATEASGQASDVLRDQGVTPERVEAEILRTVGRGTTGSVGSADPLRGIDRDALAAIGIDLDVVRARLEAAFGPDALDRAVVAHRRGAHPARRRRPAPGGHIPFTPRAKKSLQLSLRESLALHDDYVGVQHLILGQLAMRDGMSKLILSALGASSESLRAAILARYRKAS